MYMYIYIYIHIYIYLYIIYSYIYTHKYIYTDIHEMGTKRATDNCSSREEEYAYSMYVHTYYCVYLLSCIVYTHMVVRVYTCAFKYTLPWIDTDTPWRIPVCAGTVILVCTDAQCTRTHKIWNIHQHTTDASSFVRGQTHHCIRAGTDTLLHTCTENTMQTHSQVLVDTDPQTTPVRAATSTLFRRWPSSAKGCVCVFVSVCGRASAFVCFLVSRCQCTCGCGCGCGCGCWCRCGYVRVHAQVCRGVYACSCVPPSFSEGPLKRVLTCINLII